MFLGHIRPQGICFRAPAKYFPLKLLYSKSKICSYKIYFFHIQFKIIGSKQLAEIKPVSELIHTEVYWFCSSFAIKVLYNYRLFAHRLQEFCVINRKSLWCCTYSITVAYLVIWRHLALLSLFSNSVSNETKADMKAAIVRITILTQMLHNLHVYTTVKTNSCF